MITPQLTVKQTEYLGYVCAKELEDGRTAAILPRTFNTIIIADIHAFGFEEQW